MFEFNRLSYILHNAYCMALNVLLNPVVENVFCGYNENAIHFQNSSLSGFLLLAPSFFF